MVLSWMRCQRKTENRCRALAACCYKFVSLLSAGSYVSRTAQRKVKFTKTTGKGKNMRRVTVQETVRDGCGTIGLSCCPSMTKCDQGCECKGGTCMIAREASWGKKRLLLKK